MNYETIVEVLKTHLCPKRSIIAERFHFYKIDQKVNESVSNFVMELRKLASSCNFGSFLDEALTGKLVCGLPSEAIRKELYRKFDTQH